MSDELDDEPTFDDALADLRAGVAELEARLDELDASVASFVRQLRDALDHYDAAGE